jgi:hypothetical protein
MQKRERKFYKTAQPVSTSPTTNRIPANNVRKFATPDTGVTGLLFTKVPGDNCCRHPEHPREKKISGSSPGC